VGGLAVRSQIVQDFFWIIFYDSQFSWTGWGAGGLGKSSNILYKWVIKANTIHWLL
jgi:hypothetical protein